MITLSVPDMTCGHCKATVEVAPLIATLGRIGYPATHLGSQRATPH